MAEIHTYVPCKPADQLLKLIMDIRKITDGTADSDEALREICKIVNVAENTLGATEIHVVVANTTTRTARIL